jgi:rhodanese-related sulfurtransferase
VKGGAQLLDVRDAIDFEGAHLAGSLNIGIQGKYATWSGTMLNRAKPIVVVADPGREEEAIVRLGRIGFDEVKGFLKGGLDRLGSRPDLIGRIERITAVALAELRTSAEPPVIVDVRSEKEWIAGHIPGSMNLPLNHLRETIGDCRRIASSSCIAKVVTGPPSPQVCLPRQIIPASWISLEVSRHGPHRNCLSKKDRRLPRRASRNAGAHFYVRIILSGSRVSPVTRMP